MSGARCDQHPCLDRAARPLRGPWPRARPARGLRARPGPLRRLQPAGARGLRRPVEEPVRHRDTALPARPGAANAGSRRGATRCSPASRSTAPKAAPCCTRRCARRAGRGRTATRCTRCWTACWPLPSRCATRASSGIRHVVNIGIGGSDLGPAMVVPALDAYAQRGLRAALRQQRRRPRHRAGAARPEAGRDAVHRRASKTFTTQETMANAHVARAWFLAQGGSDIARHFVGRDDATWRRPPPSASPTTFGFWDWVGGRYSLWSAIGLPIAIAIGAENFRALLAGAHAMDRHFAERAAGRQPAGAARPARRLVPQLPPLHEPLGGALPPGPEPPAGLPAAAGDGVQRQVASTWTADALPFGTSPVVWGEPGTNGQHAYFQMLHQGTDVIPVEFILVKTPAHGAAPTCTPSCWPTAWRRARR